MRKPNGCFSTVGKNYRRFSATWACFKRGDSAFFLVLFILLSLCCGTGWRFKFPA